MSTYVTLIRHGQTAWNVDQRYQGQAAIPLDDAGRNQSALLGKYLASTPAHRIYCSDLIRTRQTALILNETLQLPLLYDRRLREIDVGEWQGMTRADILAWDPDRYEHVMTDRFHNVYPGGESFQMVGERAAAALWDYVRRHLEEHLLIVTHGGTIRETLRRLAGTDIPHLVANTSLTRLYYDGVTDQWITLEVAITPHLPATSGT